MATLVGTVDRHIKNMDTALTEYVKSEDLFKQFHTYYDVDERIGKYRFDCTGFVKYMLLDSRIVIPTNIGRGLGNVSGTTEQWITLAKQLRKNGGEINGWRSVNSPQPGDIVITEAHAMISMGTMKDGVLQIADSTGSPHGRDGTDTRYNGTKTRTGMGTGYIKVTPNPSWTGSWSESNKRANPNGWGPWVQSWNNRGVGNLSVMEAVRPPR